MVPEDQHRESCRPHPRKQDRRKAAQLLKDQGQSSSHRPRESQPNDRVRSPEILLSYLLSTRVIFDCDKFPRVSFDSTSKPYARVSSCSSNFQDLSCSACVCQHVEKISDERSHDRNAVLFGILFDFRENLVPLPQKRVDVVFYFRIHNCIVFLCPWHLHTTVLSDLGLLLI